MHRSTINLFSILAAGLLTLLFSIHTNNIVAQDTVSADGLFQLARKAAFEQNNYPQAKLYCNKVLEISPRYTDATVFLGRLYAWSKQYDSARINFQNALEQHSDYTDASVAYADVEYWTGNNKDALKIIDAALVYHPESIDLLLRKAKALNALHEYSEANKIVNDLLQKDKTNADARKLANILKDNASLNKIGVSYDYVYFDKQFPDPWHWASLEYTHTTKAGAITGRINYANRFGKNGIQYEAEAYPRLSKTFYAYANAGYSDNVGVFPHWRLGFSLYTNLPKGFEFELGSRYLYFSTATNIFTGSIAKYYKNYLFGFRTYLTPATNNVSQSYNVFGRYYFGGADDFVSVTAGTGISPDERSIEQQLNNKYKLKTYRAALEVRHVIKTFNIISFNTSIINQEYFPNKKGNQMQAGIKYQRRF